MMMKLEQYNDDDHDDNDDDEAVLTLQRITAAGMTENAELAASGAGRGAHHRLAAGKGRAG